MFELPSFITLEVKEERSESICDVFGKTDLLLDSSSDWMIIGFVLSCRHIDGIRVVIGGFVNWFNGVGLI